MLLLITYFVTTGNTSLKVSILRLIKLYYILVYILENDAYRKPFKNPLKLPRFIGITLFILVTASANQLGNLKANLLWNSSVVKTCRRFSENACHLSFKKIDSFGKYRYFLLHFRPELFTK